MLKGDFAVTLGKTWISGTALGGDEAVSFASGSGELQLGMDFGSKIFTQLDLLGEVTDGAGFDDTYHQGVGFAAHLMRRQSDRGGFGVFGGWLETDQDIDDTSTSERHFVGLEGLAYCGKANFFGQFGHFGGEGGSDQNGVDSLREAVFARGGVQYFLNDDLMIESEVSTAFGSMDADGDANLLAWGVKAEKRLTPMLSGTLGYSGARYDQDEDGNEHIIENMAYVSFTILFDKDTLKSRSRSSTNLGTPGFLRWSGQTGGPLE